MYEQQQLVADRYRLTNQIGGGGMGRVWLARDEMLDRDVAVKEVVLPDGLSDAEREELCERMLREARAAGRLSHPNVVAIFDVVQHGGRPWIVMEHVRSRSLYQVIKQDGPLTPRRTAEIGLEILAALRAAHRAGVWHRDVKPGNVLLAEDGRVVLTDFGLATFDGDGSVTGSGLILGSAQYIAPERARGVPSGPEADMWSLGATLFAAVEGRSPYARDSAMATLTALATEPPDTPRRAGPLRPLLIGLLRKNPRHRMRAAEAERLLRRVATGQTKGMGGRESLQPAMAGLAGAAPVGAGGAAGHSGAGARKGAGAPGDAQLREADGPIEATPAAGASRRSTMIATAVVLLLATIPIGAAISLVIGDRRGTHAATTSEPTAGQPVTPAAVLTPAMGVQACLQQLPANESAVTVGPSRGGEPALLSGWGYFRDPSGFHVAVPVNSRLSRIDSLVCFRDPTGARAIAVIPLGAVPGDPVDLLATGEQSWREAARLEGYQRVEIKDIHFVEGGADLEYTYQRDELRMHGKNRMARLNGQVFLLYWLTTEFAWPSDRALLDIVQPSFGLDATVG